MIRYKEVYAEAEPLYRLTLESHKRILGPEHPDTLSSLKNLADLLFSKGNYVEAELLLREALKGRE